LSGFTLVLGAPMRAETTDVSRFPFHRLQSLHKPQTFLLPRYHRNEASKDGLTATLSASMVEAWTSLPDSIRAALVSMERNATNSVRESSTSLSSLTLACSTTSSSSDSETDKTENSSIEIIEEDAETGTIVVLKPLDRAPLNVFEFQKTTTSEQVTVETTPATVVTTKTSVLTRTRGWRNVFTLPISYDVNITPYGTILDPKNPQLLDATGPRVEGHKNRRFAVIDDAIERLYGDKIRAYFMANNVELTTCVLQGGEDDKRPMAVDTLLDELCAYKLHRREPFLAIGGGVLLDIAGMAANLYRRGVPFVRVPTTLLAIVDASVGVKNGVDYCCAKTNDTYKNRIGSFYAPSSCLLDAAFITTQDQRNITNGFGEIMKLALVRSIDLFELLETHGASLVNNRFSASSSITKEVGTRIIDLSIQIMLEELGPNLWEHKLERCVDYGHTFSKLLEMVPGSDIMHGEAVNIDGFFCCILSYLRGFITKDTVDRIFYAMKNLGLPTNSIHLQSELAWQSCKDAVEHRHGEQRIPLITDIGESLCVSDITRDELDRALEVLQKQFSL
jgi:3-dehydroquinate synthetase